MLGGLRGFFVLEGIAYFIGLIAAVVVFAVCLFKDGALVRRSKQ